MAQSMVHQHGGTILPGTFAIGGDKAFKVSADYSVNAFTHRVTYLVAHGNYIYMVSAFNTAAADASKPLDGFLPTVSFSAPESPLKYLGELTDSPWSVFGTFTMKFPKYGRKFDSEQTLLNVGINDLSAKTLGQPFSVDIEPIQLPNPVSFAAIRDAYSANMAKALSFPADKPLKWRVEDGVPGLNVANAVKSTVKLPDGSSHELTNRMAILELSPG